MKILGQVSLDKRLLKHPVWDQEPKCYSAAWVDLLLRTNDADRSIRLNGEFVDVKRGQCVWSLRSLQEAWKRSDKWVSRFIQFCEDETMITVKSDRRGTVITVLNYDAYNSPETAPSSGSESVTDSSTESGSESVTDSSTESGSESVTDSRRKGEKGMGRGNGEGPPPDCALIPTDAEVRQFCDTFSEPASGISGIPEGWWSGWLSNRLDDTRRGFPRDWKRSLTLAFRSDWVAGHPKARGVVKKNADFPAQKNAATSPAQALFLLDRELADVEAEIQAADDLNQPIPASLKVRRKDLQKKRRELNAPANEKADASRQ